jgi:hypothetical protein
MSGVEHGGPSRDTTNWVCVTIGKLTDDQLQPAAELVRQLRDNFAEGRSLELPEAESSVAPELVVYVPTDSADDPIADDVARAAVKKALDQVNHRHHIGADGYDPLNRIKAVEWDQLAFKPGFIRIGAVFVPRRAGSAGRVLNEIDVAVKTARDALLSIVGGTSTRGVIPRVDTDGSVYKSESSRRDGLDV